MAKPALKVVSNALTIVSIPGTGFQSWWPYLSRHIEASDRGSDGIELSPHFAMEWSAGRAMMWAVIDDSQADDHDKIVGAVMTRIQDSPTGKILHVIALGGMRTNEWGEDMMIRLRHHAQSQEATRMRCQSVRKGIPRFLEQYGWTKVPVTVMEYQS